MHFRRKVFSLLLLSSHLPSLQGYEVPGQWSYWTGQIKADKKNSKQKRVVALTDEYIKSLENYLNNPNDEIRLMASKEILMRLDEDKDRYNDAAGTEHWSDGLTK